MTRRTDTQQTNALSFDLEHWHSATLVRNSVVDPVDYVERSVEMVLSLLERYDVRATFFVVGELAIEYPVLLERIRDGGHELASHGHTHTSLGDLTPQSFEQELTRSRDAIVAATGVEPIGFRAPNFSLTEETEWAIDVLEQSDYSYDSSVFPVKTPLYGVTDAPLSPYPIRGKTPFQVPDVQTQADGLVEFPLSVYDPVLRLPIAGGFYARVLPSTILQRGIRKLNERGIPVNLYFHPWEFNPAVKTNTVPVLKRLISFYGIDRLEHKLEMLLSSFQFGPVSQVLAEQGLDVEQRGEWIHSTDAAGTDAIR